MSTHRTTKYRVRIRFPSGSYTFHPFEYDKIKGARDLRKAIKDAFANYEVIVMKEVETTVFTKVK